MTGHAMIRRPTPSPCTAPQPLARSMRGNVQRGGTLAQAAGGVDRGGPALGAWTHGKNTISATWIGQVEQGSCGKERRETWNNA